MLLRFLDKLKNKIQNTALIFVFNINILSNLLCLMDIYSGFQNFSFVFHFQKKKIMKYSAFFTFFIFIRKIKKYNKTPMIPFFNKL